MIRRLPPLMLAAFAGVYLWQAFAIPLDPWSASEAINARTLPFVYAGVLMMIALALAIRPPPGETSDSGRFPRRWRTLAAHSTAIVAFGVLIGFVGLWISVAALLAATLLIAGERRPSVIVLAPVGTAAVAWLLIAVVLDVYIHPGRAFS